MFCVLSNFTRSSIAPTLFGRKTENCFTSGPSIFEVVCGKSTAIWVARCRGKSASRIDNYLIADLSLANPIYWALPHPRDSLGQTHVICQKVRSLHRIHDFNRRSQTLL